MYLAIRGAYGRIYTGTAHAVMDWDEGKDFQIVGGPYISVRDAGALRAEGYDGVEIMQMAKDYSTVETLAYIEFA